MLTSSFKFFLEGRGQQKDEQICRKSHGYQLLNIMILNKFKALNRVKLVMIVFIISSCLPCCKAYKDVYNLYKIRNLIQKLSNEDHDVREKAISSLAKIGKPAIEPLITALKDKDRYYIGEGAAKTLGKIGKPAVEPLITTLRDKTTRYVREWAEKALVSCQPSSAG